MTFIAYQRCLDASLIRKKLSCLYFNWGFFIFFCPCLFAWCILIYVLTMSCATSCVVCLVYMCHSTIFFSQGIIHMDIASRNILLHGNNHVKISNFSTVSSMIRQLLATTRSCRLAFSLSLLTSRGTLSVFVFVSVSVELSLDQKFLSLV